MIRYLTVIALMAFGLVQFGCSAKHPAQELTDTYTSFTKSLAEAGGDCDKSAKAVAGMKSKKAGLVAATKKLEELVKKGKKEEIKALQAKYPTLDGLEKGFRIQMKALKLKCKDSKAFVKAAKELKGD